MRWIISIVLYITSEWRGIGLCTGRAVACPYCMHKPGLASRVEVYDYHAQVTICTRSDTSEFSLVYANLYTSPCRMHMTLRFSAAA